MPSEAKPTEPPITTTPLPETTTVTEPPVDLITCEFEKDFCQWDSKSEDEKYVWFRNTSDALQEAGILGPLTDFTNEKNTFFIMTSNYQAQEVLPGKKAKLTSPYFLGKDHQNECFSFWFYFGVSESQ